MGIWSAKGRARSSDPPHPLIHWAPCKGGALGGWGRAEAMEVCPGCWSTAEGKGENWAQQGAAGV